MTNRNARNLVVLLILFIDDCQPHDCRLLEITNIEVGSSLMPIREPLTLYLKEKQRTSTMNYYDLPY